MTILRTWTLPLPQTVPLSINRQKHWAVTGREVKQVRTDARTLCKAHRIPALTYAQVQLHFQPGTNRKRDVDSLVKHSKATLDGIRDAGVIPDDTPEYVDHLMPTLLPVVKGEPRLWFVIHELAA